MDLKIGMNKFCLFHLDLKLVKKYTFSPKN